MDTIAFAPSIDVPLVLATVVLLLRNFNRWAVSSHLETNVDLAARLPTARMRVISLFAVILVFCWLVNLAVWTLFAVLLGVGLAIALLLSGDVIGGEMGLRGAAYLLREWSFGFPETILEPPAPASITRPPDSEDGALIGETGVARTPIRPTGLVEFDNAQVTVSSADGRFIAAGTEVVVATYRNGTPCVIPSPDA